MTMPTMTVLELATEIAGYADHSRQEHGGEGSDIERLAREVLRLHKIATSYQAAEARRQDATAGDVVGVVSLAESFLVGVDSDPLRASTTKALAKGVLRLSETESAIRAGLTEALDMIPMEPRWPADDVVEAIARLRALAVGR